MIGVGKLDVRLVARAWMHAVVHDEVAGLAAELAYYFFLSLFPFFIFLTALGGIAAALLHVQNPTEQIVSILGVYMPTEATRLVRPEIERIIGRQEPGTLSLGLIFALWVATSGANAVIRAMNRAYDVQETRPFLGRYVLAFGLTVLSAAVLVVSFILFVGANVFGQGFSSALGLEGAYDWLLDTMSWLLVVALLLPGSAFLYWAAPNIHLRTLWVLPGAVFFTVGWLIATYLFTFYVGQFGSYGATYGALGGVAALLVWLYLSGFVLLTGAELNAAIDRQVDPEGVAAERRRSTSKVGAAQ